MTELLEQFSDVTPVKLNEEEPQLCQILYDDEYKQVMGVLLALLAKKEYSERAFKLTELGIELLASHYTIWNYRYNILLHLEIDLLEELSWCEQLALDNEKNYQIWNYRQLVIERIVASKGNFNAHHEYPILDAMLSQDSKNHHVWSYRKWLVQRFQLYGDEREVSFVEKCIKADLRNNSAWTHRFFIKFGDESAKASDAVIAEEIEYTRNQIEVCPQNPSSWNYLIGIYNKYKEANFLDLEDFCLKFADIEGSSTKDEEVATIKSAFALELLAKISMQRENYNKAKKIYTLLKDKYDPIRKNYWDFQLRQISA